MMIFWPISHLLSTALNVISSRMCIAFLWAINCLLSPQFPALITIFGREQNFKFFLIKQKIRVRVEIGGD